MPQKQIEIVPITIWSNPTDSTQLDSVAFHPGTPVLRKVLERRGIRLRRANTASFLDKITSMFRIFIIEGIPGSGKDTFQEFLKERFRNGTRVYEYSEGELLHSWKHVPIPGILELRIKFMKLFVNYLEDMVICDESAVFLLNRFHLSAYVTTVTRNLDLEGEYNDIVKILRTLPVHVFLMNLDETEIHERSSHGERSTTWDRHQQHSVKKDGFQDTLQRYKWQQGTMLDLAKQQQIPFSILKLTRRPKGRAGWIHAPKNEDTAARDLQPPLPDVTTLAPRTGASSKLARK